jgi:hypothetical protein
MSMPTESDHRKARHTFGLNDFEYRASLHVDHPSIEPDVISRSIPLEPTRFHRAGEPRRTPTGQPLEGNYPSTHWFAELPTRDGEDLSGFLAGMTRTLEPAATFLQQIAAEGGRTECFLGVFAFALCDQLFPAEQLATLGKLCVDLRIDYYGVPDSKQETN